MQCDWRQKCYEEKFRNKKFFEYLLYVYVRPLIPTRGRFDDFMEKEIEIKGD